MPTTALSLLFGALISLTAGAGPYLADKALALVGLHELHITGFQADRLRIAELLFVSIAMIGAAWVCVIDALLGHVRHLITIPIGILCGFSVAGAFLIFLSYAGMLIGDSESLFVSRMVARETAVTWFVISCCAVCFCIQVLIYRRYRHALDASDALEYAVVI